MTKEERLKELSDFDRFCKAADRQIFDPMWREFVKKVRSENQRWNIRLLMAVGNIRGHDFVQDIIDFMSDSKNKFSRLSIVRKPSGILFKDNRYKNIPEMWVSHQSGQFKQGTVSVQVKENRWLQFHY